MRRGNWCVHGSITVNANWAIKLKQNAMRQTDRRMCTKVQNEGQK